MRMMLQHRTSLEFQPTNPSIGEGSSLCPHVLKYLVDRCKYPGSDGTHFHLS